MILIIWKRPSLDIIGWSIILNLLWTLVPFFIVGNIVDDKDTRDELFGAIGITYVIIVGLSIIVADIRHRRRRSIGLFSLESSTMFFLIPTWLIGAAVLGFGLLGMLGAILADR
jgi:Ca2+/Na+ antiporter